MGQIGGGAMKENQKSLLVVGVTGIIGSGKSTFSRFWEELGARVLNTDRLAREIMENSTAVRRKIEATFGRDSYDEAGRLNRRKIADWVFRDPEALRRLNAIVHPEVIRAVRDQIRELAQEGFHGLVVVDAPLIFETGLVQILDATVVVAASEETCVRRVKARSGLTEEEVKARLKNQWPLEEKIRRADFVVWNEGSLEQLKKQAVALFEKLTEKIKDKPKP